MDFLALDVETANPDFGSICQIGIVGFEDGLVREAWQTLVDPEDYFDSTNVSIHGIDEERVKDAPTFPEVFAAVSERLARMIVATHTPFDRVALQRASERYGLPEFNCTWLDTARVVRRTWSEFSRRGYGLANVAERLRIRFAHHNAQEDARAAGEILVCAMQETGMTVKEWLDRVRKPIDLSRFSAGPPVMDGDPDGPLYSEVLVFTGSLRITRDEAAEMAARTGCKVARGVTKETTILVVGDQDIRKLAGHEKSSKHRKAEALIAQGQTIRILRESDFAHLVLFSG